LNNAVVAKGLHQEIQPDARTPFFLAQFRKRAFLQAYGVDLSIASFLGRPPRLSYRYCIIDLPLDLGNHEILLEGSRLQTALDSLDEYGWNRQGKMSRTTWLRAWLCFAPRREDILDLSLGSYTKEEVLRRAKEIQRLSDEQWLKLPKWLELAREQPPTVQKLPLDTLHNHVIRQGYLANELLLQRVLIRKAGADIEKLIETARQIYRDIISITARHDIAKDFQLDMTYLLAAHGLRSAAIIAVELLKQEQLPIYPAIARLPRSETIQELSVFAARLGSVHPSDGSFAICDQGRKVITRILDKILAPPQNCLTELDENIPSGQILGLHQTRAYMGDTGPGLEAPLNLESDNEFMQWLENMDCESGAWTNFG
jgi:hypothetical protein